MLTLSLRASLRLARLRKMRPFRLGIVLPIVCAAFIALVSPALATAQVQVCNPTKYPIVFAYSVTTPLSNAQGLPTGTAIIVLGWYSVASTACYVVEDTVYTGQLFYFYGVEVGNPKALPYEGTYLRCVGSILNATQHFQYIGAKATPPCAAGEMQVGMAQFAIPYATERLGRYGGTFNFYAGPNG